MNFTKQTGPHVNERYIIKASLDDDLELQYHKPCCTSFAFFKIELVFENKQVTLSMVSSCSDKNHSKNFPYYSLSMDKQICP